MLTLSVICFSRFGGGGIVFYRVDSLSSNVWRSYLNFYFFPPLSVIYFSIGSLYYKNKNQLLIRFSRCSQELEWYCVKLQYLYVRSNYIDEHCSLFKRVVWCFHPPSQRLSQYYLKVLKKLIWKPRIFGVNLRHTCSLGGLRILGMAHRSCVNS